MEKIGKKIGKVLEERKSKAPLSAFISAEEIGLFDIVLIRQNKKTFPCVIFKCLNLSTKCLGVVYLLPIRKDEKYLTESNCVKRSALLKSGKGKVFMRNKHKAIYLDSNKLNCLESF